MNREANAFAFISGLSAGAVNLVCALVVLQNAIVAMEYVPNPALIPAASGLVVFAGIGLAGGCVCKRNRATGGILMLAGAFLLLLVAAACLYLSLTMPDFFTDVAGAEFGSEVRSAALGAGILLTFTNLLLTAAGITSLLVPAKPGGNGPAI